MCGEGGGWSATLSPLSIRGTARGAARWLTVSGQSVTGGRCRLRRSISLLGARFSIDGEFQRLGGRSSRAGCGKPHEWVCCHCQTDGSRCRLLGPCHITPARAQVLIGAAALGRPAVAAPSLTARTVCGSIYHRRTPWYVSVLTLLIPST